MRYFSHPESKSAGENLLVCGRGTKGLLHRRHAFARVIVHIGKEANHLDQRESGELTTEAATDLLLDYHDPSADTWRCGDLPRLRELPLKQITAITGLSERRLRDIYDGLSMPRQKTRLLIQAMLAEQTQPFGAQAHIVPGC